MRTKQSKRVVVLTKPITKEVGLKRLPLLRFMSKRPEVPVIILDNNKARLNWTIQLINDVHHMSIQDYLDVDDYMEYTPSQYYEMLCQCDERIPTFYLATKTRNGFTHIMKGSNREVNELIQDYIAMVQK